jgi:predicted TIM-barrel enzyme
MNSIIEDDSAEKQSIWAELPSFVERGDGFIDGWKPAPAIGDDDLDKLMGELYADIAVRHARQIQDPAFVGMVLAAIYFKTTRGLIVMGATEQGFLNRLARLAYVGSLN